MSRRSSLWSDPPHTVQKIELCNFKSHFYFMVLPNVLHRKTRTPIFSAEEQAFSEELVDDKKTLSKISLHGENDLLTFTAH